jgi:hypothetical protein
VAKINISSLRRDHLINYQEFLQNPVPKKLWCGSSVARLKKMVYIVALSLEPAFGEGADSKFHLSKSFAIFKSGFK